MKRVMIVGEPGSGKTTMALLLGAKTGLPVFHMDHIHWKPGLLERSREEKIALVRKVIQRDQWIFEGDHRRSFAERVERADTLIWLDIPIWRRLWRINKRALLALGKTRPDMPEDCPERLRNIPEFNIFVWRRRHLKPAEQVVKNPPPHIKVHRLQTLGEIKHVIDGAG